MKTLITFLIFSFLLACTDQSKSSDSTDLVSQGKLLFNQKHLGKEKVIGCILCHSVEEGKQIIGPSLAGLSIRASHLVKDQTAKQYIENSIRNPDAYIVEGFTPAVMLSNYSEVLNKDEIEALVAYLMTL